MGFIFMALIAGWAIDRFPGKYALQAAGMVLGTAVCYVFGTVWLAGQLGIAGLGVGVIPYLPGDAVKILFAVMVGARVRRDVRRVMEG